MPLHNAIKLAATYLGLPAQTLSPLESTCDDPLALEDLTSLVSETFHIDEPNDREEAINELIFDHPCHAQLYALLLQNGWLADRPIDRACLAHDLLSMLYLPPSLAGLADRLRADLAAAPPELAPFLRSPYAVTPDEITLLLSGALNALAAGDATNLPTQQAKIDLIQSESVSEENRRVLTRAALFHADYEAALLLDQFAGWDDPVDDHRFYHAESVLDRAYALLTAGLRTYPLFLLTVLQARYDDEESLAHLIDLAIEDDDLDAAQRLHERTLASDLMTDDIRDGLAARLALRREQDDQALDLLRPYFAAATDDPDDFAEENPWLVIAANEHAIITGTTNAIQECLFPYSCDRAEDRHANRLLAFDNFVTALDEDTPLHAIHQFAPVLSAFPASAELWQLYQRTCDHFEVDPIAQQLIAAQLLRHHPASRRVWHEALQLLPPESAQLIADALPR